MKTEKHNKLFIIMFFIRCNNNGLCLQTSAAHAVKHTANIIQNQISKRGGNHSHIEIRPLAFANPDRYSGHQHQYKSYKHKNH